MKLTVIFVLSILILAASRCISSASAKIDSPATWNYSRLEAFDAPVTGSPEVTVMLASSPTLGKFLVDNKGRTLYLFKKDALTDITCYNHCESDWPPLLDDGNLVPGQGVTGDLDVTPRRDGRHQVTYNGMPLYYYAGDTQPDQASGQGRNNEWYIVVP